MKKVLIVSATLNTNYALAKDIEKILIDLNVNTKTISLEKDNCFSISYLGTVNNQNKLSIYQSNNLIIDVDVTDLKNTYKNAIYNKISK